MRLKSTFFCFFLLVVVAKTASEEISLAVYFSPNGGVTSAILKEIDLAKTSIKVQAYGFTSKPIASSLVDAKKRGVLVSVILDRSNISQTTSQLSYLKNHGVSLFIDSSHSIAHNKVIIIDDFSVITGSFNFTNNAETRNAENIVIIHDKKTNSVYTENWINHSKHSKPF